MDSTAAPALAASAIGEAFALPARHANLRAEAAEVASRFAGRHREVRLHGVEHSKLHPELWREIKGHGWPGLLVPGSHGGTEGGLLGYVLVMEELAAASIILWMPVLAASIGHAIAQAGPDHARNRWLARIAAGKALLGLAVTEPQCGHNVLGARQYQLTFNDVIAPAEALVGAEGQGLLVLSPAAHIERLLTAALCLGAARYCIAKARSRAAERTVFGKLPIGAEHVLGHPRHR